MAFTEKSGDLLNIVKSVASHLQEGLNLIRLLSYKVKTDTTVRNKVLHH